MQEAVTVSLQELVDGSISPETLTNAFGPSSLGIIIVKDLPPEFKALRAQALSNASYLAALEEGELESLTSPQTNYLTGWSCGKETLRSGHFDSLKGSYYINCAFYQDPSLQGAPSHGKEGGRNDDLTSYTAPNIWPSETSLPGFRSAAEELCGLIIDTAGLVARACDRFAMESIQGYEEGFLERVVKGSYTSKARLLHYFPSPASSSDGQESGKDGEEEDDWCATHLDHSCLTGLTSAMFIDETSSLPSASSAQRNEGVTALQPLPELPRSPDPAAGLYIRSRTDEVVKVNIPKDCLAFQTGEALELITRGKFRAVPHFVKGAKSTGDRRVARNTLAVFTQPNLDEEVQPGRSFGDFARDVVKRTY